MAKMLLTVYACYCINAQDCVKNNAN